MDESRLLKEIFYKAVRSSGPGGQNVNKVSSKVNLHFDLDSSEALSEEEKILIRKKLESRLTNSNAIFLQSDESRSQHRNKEVVTERFLTLIKDSLKKPKIRKRTNPTKASKLKRLRGKKIQSEKKSQRKNPLL